MKDRTSRVALVTTVVALCLAASAPHAQMHHGGAMHHGDKTVGPPPPIRTTMEALHAQGGVPRGWTFLMPPGEAGEGRKVFVAMECYACHEVKGEQFSRAPRRRREPGPELTGMGAHHPAEYLAESILNPNRVIVEAPGYTGDDGRSKMPSYADTMTLKQLGDLVAYLMSLTGGHASGGASQRTGATTTSVGVPAR